LIHGGAVRFGIVEPPEVKDANAINLKDAREFKAALEQLMPVIYAELHKLARRHMQRQNPNHTLQTTALIHEAYLKLAGDSRKDWESRAQFYGVAAKATRHVL